MKFHDELNPKIWNEDNTLKIEVGNKLQEIANAFIDYLSIPQESIKDIRITGSSANYNYTEHSDLDLHIIVDYDKVHKDCPLVEGYLWSHKSNFNSNHDIHIYDIPVELYAEDSEQEAVSNGVYSLLENKWIKEPRKIPPTNNDSAVFTKYDELKEAIDKCDDSEVASQLLDKIYEMRKSGLAEVGEFSTENMAFKLLRNDGSIDKLKKLKKEKVDKQLSLESYNEAMYIDEKDVPPLHDYAIIFKYQEPWPDGKLAYRAIMKLTTGSSYRMQSWSYTKEGMINIVKNKWPYADIVDKTNELVSESYNNVRKFNVNDKVRKGKRIAIIKKVDSSEKGYLDVEFEDGKNNGAYPSQYFRKITEALNTNILKALVQKYPYHTVGTVKQMAKELEDLTDIGCVLEIRESNSWHSCYTIFKKKDINKWESTYICDGKLIEEQTWIATTYDVAENITSEDNRVNNVTIKQEALESTKSIKETTMLLNKLNKAINEALEQDYDKVSAQDIRRWFESKTKYKKQNDPEFYVRSAVKQFPQLKGKEEELRKNIEKQKAKNKPWYPYMDAVKDTLKDVNAFEESVNEALQLNRRGTIKKLNNETAVVEFPEVPEQEAISNGVYSLMEDKWLKEPFILTIGKKLKDEYPDLHFKYDTMANVMVGEDSEGNIKVEVPLINIIETLNEELRGIINE